MNPRLIVRPTYGACNEGLVTYGRSTGRQAAIEGCGPRLGELAAKCIGAWHGRPTIAEVRGRPGPRPLIAATRPGHDEIMSAPLLGYVASSAARHSMTHSGGAPPGTFGDASG